MPTLKSLLLATLIAPVALCATANPAHAAGQCAPPPPGDQDIRGIGYYTDAASSKIDPALQAEGEALARPLNDYARHVTDMSDRYLDKGDVDAARCTLTWLAAWAGDGAMLGRMLRENNDQPDYLRQWTHAAVAMAYLKTSALATPEQRAAIEPWLKTLSQKNLAYWDNLKHKRNNHYYWTGVGIMATALATHDDALRAVAQGIYRKGIDDIAPDGTLPMEMARGQRALHYHDYATAPLVMMAELARLDGQDWYGWRDHAIERLAERVAAGYQDPSWFAQRSGVAQEAAEPKGSSGWVEFYRLRSPHPELFAAMHDAGPFRDPRLGGNLTLMARDGIVRATP